MKFSSFLIALFFAGTLAAQSDFFYRADAFMQTYTKDGRVNYNALREDPAELNWLVNYMANQPVKKATRKAYLINAYNILVINKLVKHPTLVNNPLKINNFFDAKDATLNGQQVSLNQLENEMIRPVYNDPRVHFVLVCGGLGCPPIAGNAYMPNTLEMQLDKQTKIALNNDDFVSENADKKTIQLSKIFEWYQSDFGASEAAVINYINGYRETPFNTKFKTRYYAYDWSINKGDFTIEKVMPKADAAAEELNTTANEVTDTATEKPQTDINNQPIADTATTEEVWDDIITVQNDIPNLQTFTAGSLLGRGKFDFTLFNTLYTETSNNWLGETFTGYRATFVTHLAQITYGITKSKRINVGLDLNFTSSGRSSFTDFSEVSRAFNYQNNDSTRVGLSSVGLRLKIQPFANVGNFSIQSTLSLPTIKHPEGFNDPEGLNNLYWSTWDRVTWWNQFFLDKTFGKFQLFTEFDLLFRFKRFDSQIGMLDLPASVFFSYFPTSKITVYGMTQHVARFTNNINPQDPIVTDWVIPMNYTASGVGVKYQILSNLNVEVLYTNFWRGKNSGLGETFNIGIKYLTK